MQATRPTLSSAQVADLPEVKWPQEFETHIFTKTEELKHTLDALLIKYCAK